MPKKFYFLAPSFTINPASPIAPKLGSILPNLTRLTNSLNQKTLLDVQEDSKNNSSASNFSDTVASNHGSTIGLNANILQGIGGSGDITYGYSREKSNIYTCDTLITEEFEPDKVFVNNSIAASDDVKQFLEDSLPGRKRVFMVTGLRIASGFRQLSTKVISHGPVLKVGIDTTALGVPGEVGPQVELELGKGRDLDTGVATNDIVFAYRVIKIKVKGDGTAKWKYKSGGKYAVGSDEGDSDSEDEDEEVFGVEDVDENE